MLGTNTVDVEKSKTVTNPVPNPLTVTIAFRPVARGLKMEGVNAIVPEGPTVSPKLKGAQTKLAV